MGAGRATRGQHGQTTDDGRSDGLSSRAVKIALPVALVLGVGAAVAVAAIPGNDGTIAGCFAGTSGVITINGAQFTEPPGSLRLIDPAASSAPPGVSSCQDGEQQVVWNQQGPPGPQGQQGAPGAQGPQGPAGPSGGGQTSFGLRNKSGPTYLKLDGIKGEVKDKKHKDWIEIQSWSFGASNSHTTGGGGGSKAPSPGNFQILKKVDKATPKLFAAAVGDKQFKHATVTLLHGKKKVEEYLQIKMTNVHVTSVHDGPSSKGTPSEELSFTYQKITWTFVGRNGRPATASPTLTISGNN
jgi:type VI secretion system secreted protein Hcp